MDKLIPIVLRELLWLFAALLIAAILATVLHAALQAQGVLYKQLLAEVPSGAPFQLGLLFFALCLVGVYVSRLAVAAVDSLLKSQR
ncbi:hypothetical protein [Hymenobacter pini]|uniref:hypothetical protein n=1 Tax=Hymenobacter pini TaxID=2880879 RepID=UPI001CF2B2DE|nr:hypothetical protein [Hymenobacter pini]MCA8829707.1 hypothetical protein [Hymenobacter pini]